MAEIQKTTQSGAMTQRFIEFIMMQAQNAALFLGQIPNPQSGEPEVNLELARMFIDQLVMIQEKTRGNLSTEEATALRNTLSNLQMAFVDVSQHMSGARGAGKQEAPPSEIPVDVPSEEPSALASEAAPTTAAPESESRKKFTKSYGA